MRKHIHTTVSEKTYNILNNLALSTYGSISKVIEEAVELIIVKEDLLDDIKISDLEEYKLWHLMRSVFSMVAVGRTTFMSLIDKIPTETQENNNCIELIEWFYNKTISTLTLYEILFAIKKIWIAGNYFEKIQIEQQDKSENIEKYGKKFEVAFFHNYNQIKYGKYWSQYFKTVLEKDPINFNCNCEIQLRNEVFYMKITQIDKPKIKKIVK